MIFTSKSANLASYRDYIQSAEFQEDTDEHGWPSFRAAELVRENLAGGGVDDDSEVVYSRCGTHLGSYEPDDQGGRWCIDLSCVAGNPAETLA